MKWPLVKRSRYTAQLERAESMQGLLHTARAHQAELQNRLRGMQIVVEMWERTVARACREPMHVWHDPASGAMPSEHPVDTFVIHLDDHGELTPEGTADAIRLARQRVKRAELGEREAVEAMNIWRKGTSDKVIAARKAQLTVGEAVLENLQLRRQLVNLERYCLSGLPDDDPMRRVIFQRQIAPGEDPDTEVRARVSAWQKAAGEIVAGEVATLERKFRELTGGNADSHGAEVQTVADGS